MLTVPCHVLVDEVIITHNHVHGSHTALQEELAKVEKRVADKRSQVESLLIQILSFKNLMKRNRERVASLGVLAQNSSISLPFILANTSKKTTIDCSISSDK